MPTAADIVGFDADVALVSMDEVKAAFAESLSTATAPDYEDGATGQVAMAAVLAATEEVEGYLDRRITLGRLDLLPAWRASSHPSHSYEAYAPEWPVFEAVTEGVTLGPVKAGAQMLYSETTPFVVDAYVGHCRAVQALGDIQGVAGYEAITVRPATLPPLIREVLLKLAALEFRNRLMGKLDNTRKTQVVGGTSVTVESMDTKAKARELERLHAWRKL